MTIQVVALVKRRPEMTHEEFIDYWSNHHAPLISSLEVAKKYVVKYTQFHVLSKETAILEAMGLTVAPYDGITTFEVESLVHLAAFLADDDFQKRGVPDEDKFLDKTNMPVVVGVSSVKHEK